MATSSGLWLSITKVISPTYGEGAMCKQIWSHSLGFSTTENQHPFHIVSLLACRLPLPFCPGFSTTYLLVRRAWITGNSLD